MNAAALVADVHLVATLMMAGLIWFVQVVHYPLFKSVGGAGFATYATEHARRTSYVVGPLMLAEAGAAAALVALASGTPRFPLALASAGLLALIWISTAAVQVPCHRRLAAGREDGTVARLVASNWVRTVAWTARVPLALLLARP